MIRRVKLHRSGSRGPRLSRLVAPAVALAEQFSLEGEEGDEEKPEVPAVKWIHVASEGEFTGHVDGEFKLDRPVFDAFVKNFRADPRYKAGDDGKGSQAVIPFDFEHASELPATSGSIPVSGAPAPAWALEFEVRNAADGAAELWVLAELGETIRGYIADNAYRFVSIAFSLDASDPETNKSVGPRISSIAFTNHPFLRDLAPLAARELHGEQLRTLSMWFDPAGSPQQGMEYTRQCLGLGATATVDQIKTEVGKLAAFAAAPDTTPPGLDLGEVFEGLRKIWSLPVTASVAEITSELDKASTMITAASAPVPVVPPAPSPAPDLSAQQAQPPITAPLPAAPVVPPAPLGPTTMTFEDFKKKLVKALSSRVSQIKLTDEVALEEAVVDAVKDADTLGSVLSALGVKNAADALAAIPTLQDAKVKLEAALAALNDALAMQAEQEQSMDSVDVEAAASAKGLEPVAVATALSAHRTNLMNVEVGKLSEADRGSPRKLADARREGRKAFLTHYGVAPAGQERLLKNLVAGPNGTQLRPPDSEEPKTNERQVKLRDGKPRVINLSGCEGRNAFERLMSHVRGQEGGAKLTHDQAYSKARELQTQAAKGLVEFEGDEDAA